MAEPPRSPGANSATGPDWRRLYPFESHFVETECGRIHYVDEGSGPAVVLLHGNPTWSFMFRDLIRVLADSGRRAIAVDHIGCGLSDKPQALSTYRLARHIGNVEQVLDSLGLERADLVLHDWGGAIGMGCAVRRPDRFGRIVLMNTAAFFIPRCPWRIRLARLPGIGEIAVRGFNAFARAALRMASAAPERLTPEVRAGYLAPYGSYHDRVATLGFVRDIPFSPRHPSRATLEAIQNGLDTLAGHRILLCWGMRDFVFTPEFLEIWRGYYPDAEVAEFPEAGHYLLEDAREEVNRVIREFLLKP